jgi:hypothetical protein
VSPRCIHCGAIAKDAHHLTLRDENGERLDEELTAPFCRPCHLAEHNVLRVLELEGITSRLSAVERVELRLRRVAVFLARLDLGYREVWTGLAAALTSGADDLAADTRRRDVRDPDWRDADGAA